MEDPTLESFNFQRKITSALSREDKIFTSQGEDYWNNACLNWGYDKWWLYASGYKSAADLLVTEIEDGRNNNQDILVYPIIFLYRQYLELQVKHAIGMSRTLLGIKITPFTTHNIHTLWVDLQRLLDEIFQKNLPKELPQIRRLILEIEKIDKKSDAFRFPILQDGTPSLPELKLINLRNIREVIDKIALTFSGLNSMLDERLQNSSTR